MEFSCWVYSSVGSYGTLPDRFLNVSSIGDIADAMMAFAILNTCRRVKHRLPLSAEMQMYFNIALAFGIGLVPIVGDMADVLFIRANTRNAIILENHLRGQIVDEEVQEDGGPQWWQNPHLMN